MPTCSTRDILVRRPSPWSAISLRRAVLAAACLFFLAGPAQAGPAENTSALGESTRIEVDEQDDVIRFYIEGEEAARLDADGFHVRGNVDLGGVMINRGAGHYEDGSGTGESAPSGETDAEAGDAP